MKIILSNNLKTKSATYFTEKDEVKVILTKINITVKLQK